MISKKQNAGTPRSLTRVAKPTEVQPGVRGPARSPMCHLSPLWHSARLPLRAPGQAGSVGGRQGLGRAHSPIRSILVTSRISGTFVVADWKWRKTREKSQIISVFTNSSSVPPAHVLGDSPFHSFSLHKAGQQPKHPSLPPFSFVTN